MADQNEKVVFSNIDLEKPDFKQISVVLQQLMTLAQENISNQQKMNENLRMYSVKKT